jgi:hypothetical protein
MFGILCSFVRWGHYDYNLSADTCQDTLDEKDSGNTSPLINPAIVIHAHMPHESGNKLKPVGGNISTNDLKFSRQNTML